MGSDRQLSEKAYGSADEAGSESACDCCLGLLMRRGGVEPLARGRSTLALITVTTPGRPRMTQATQESCRQQRYRPASLPQRDQTPGLNGQTPGERPNPARSEPNERSSPQAPTSRVSRPTIPQPGPQLWALSCTADPRTHRLVKPYPSLVPTSTPDPFRLPEKHIRLINNVRSEVVDHVVVLSGCLFPVGVGAGEGGREGTVAVVVGLELVDLAELGG